MPLLRTLLLAALLAAARPAAAEVVELVNGDRLTGAVIEQTDEHVVLEHPVLGRVTLAADQVASVSPEAAADQAAQTPQPSAAPLGVTPPPAETDKTEPQADEDPEWFGVPILPGWDRRFEAGLDGAEGNSETFNVRVAFMGDYEDQEDRWHVGSAFVRQTADGDATRNDFFAEAIRDWLIPDQRHFYFGQARYDYDDFQAWRQRVSAAGGVGYELIDREEFDLIGRVGGGANYTWDGEADDELTPEALLGIEGAWQIDDAQSFEFKNTLYPSLGEVGEFRNLTSLAYVIEMDQAKGMSLKLGLENEYESVTDDDSEHNDLKYFAALVFEF